MSTNEYEIVESPEDDEQNSFMLALRSQWQSSPWYVSSVGIHSLIFLFLLLLPAQEPTQQVKRIVIHTEIMSEEEKLEEVTPDIVERDPEVVTDTTSTEPVPLHITTDFEISDHNETDNDMDMATARGDPDNISTFDGAQGTPSLIGVGSSGGRGGGGKYGFRNGGGKKNSVARSGGSRKTELAVDWALRWLAEHQEPDGHWNCQKYGGKNHDVAATSFALLAFLGAGNSSKFGKYRTNVAKGTYWLIQQQKANGCIGPHRYEAGIALMAISEAFGMGDRSVHDNAQKAVNWAVESQCPSGGWNYSPSSERVDSSVTGWWIMGLKSAKVAGLNIPYETLEKALKYMQQATSDPKNDKGYGGTSTLSYSSKTNNVKNVKRGGGSTRLTCVSLTSLQFLGRPRTDPQVLATANKTIQDGFCDPQKFDFYRWYYGALGVFQMGARSDYWRKWNEPMKKALLSTQVKAGTFKENKGSWNYETDKYGPRWGRVSQTALGALMLEVYYRYYSLKDRK